MKRSGIGVHFERCVIHYAPPISVIAAFETIITPATHEANADSPSSHITQMRRGHVFITSVPSLFSSIFVFFLLVTCAKAITCINISARHNMMLAERNTQPYCSWEIASGDKLGFVPPRKALIVIVCMPPLTRSNCFKRVSIFALYSVTNELKLFTTWASVCFRSSINSFHFCITTQLRRPLTQSDERSGAVAGRPEAPCYVMLAMLLPWLFLPVLFI